MPNNKRARWGHIETVVPGEKYRIFWPEPADPRTGRRRQPSRIIYGTWDDADVALNRMRIAKTGTVDPGITYDDYWRQVVWPSCADLASKTKSGYSRVYEKELSKRIGHARVSDTTHRLVCRVIEDIDAPSVQRAAHALWKKMCNMAIHDFLLDRNPVDRTVRMKKRNKRVKGTIDAGELFALLSKLRGSRYLFPVILECVGGLRHEEACPTCGADVSEHIHKGRRYAMVRIHSGLITVNGRKELKDTKTESSERVQLFAEPFASILLDAAKDPGPILRGRSPKGEEPNETWFANPQHLSRNWRKWCERNGVGYVRFADMRTIYSDWHAEAESIDSVVQKSMGHDDGSTRGRNYQNRTIKALVRIADNLADYIMAESPCGWMMGDILDHETEKPV